MKHIPVLLNAIMRELGDIHGKTILDATFGAGGYTRAFLDADANVIAADFGDRFRFVPQNFSQMADLDETFDAIVFDLGISSMQIDIAERGFSFRADAPLDMRMSGDGMSARDLIQQSSVADLAKILRDYGDIKKANVLARAIIENQPQTTFQLRDLIYDKRDIAPVFQALRIAVNDEIGELVRALSAVPKLLKPHGKCLVVTFHSIEDRIVKNTFREWATIPGNPHIPVAASAPFSLIRAVVPDADELEHNPRARSAHCRGVQKSY